MINIRNLIDFLPSFFKDKDTYKDKDPSNKGRGILERFLEICGNYFTDNIKSTIDNSLDVINLETTSSQYLAWLWELLGQIPFANSYGTLPFKLTERQQRDLIKHCNELLKIRGSKDFFEIMFSLYSNDENQLQLVKITQEDHGWEDDIRGIKIGADGKIIKLERKFISNRSYKDGNFVEKEGVQSDSNVLWPYFDIDNLDDKTLAFDEYYRMRQCIKVTFDITGNFSGHEDSANKAIRAFIEKYVPYNVNPIIKVNGVVITDIYDLVLEVLDNGIWKEPTNNVLDEQSQIKEPVELGQGQILKVRVYAKNTSDQIVEGIGITSKLNGGDIVTRTSIYEFEISNVVDEEDNIDEYTFTLEGNPTTSGGKTKTLKVTKKAEDKITYNISIDKESEQLTNTNREGTCTVTAYYTVNGNDEDKHGTSVMCLETGEVKTPETGKVTTEWAFTIPGKYTFIMIGHTSSQVTYELKEFGVNYTVTLCKAVKGNDGSWKEAEEGYKERITISGTQYNQLKFFVKVVSNDSKISKDKLKCFILGNPSKQYSSGELVTAPGFDTYTIVPVNAKAGDGSTNAILETVNENLVFHTHLFDREKDSKGVEYPFEINNTKSSIWAEFQATPVSNQARYEVAKGLVMVVELPNDKTIEVNHGETTPNQIDNPEGCDCTIVGTGIKSADGTYTINNVKITSRQGGVYKIWPKVYPHSKAIWEVTDNRISEELPEGIMIVPDKGSSGWTGGNTSNATCQLSSNNTKAIFKLVCYKTEKGNRYAVDVPLARVTASNGKSYTLGIYYTETEIQDITFTVTNTKYSDGSTFKQATLHILDFVTEVKLKCTPVSAILNNGQAVTKISISSNREGVDLKAKLQGTEDLYENGDTFLANEAKKYTFIAMLNGKPAVDQEGNQITCTFTVVDPSQIVVTPSKLVFEADGSPSSTGDTIQITTGENTNWILVMQ